MMKKNYVVCFLSLTTLMNIVLLGVCETYKPLQWSPLNPLFQATSDRNTSAYRINVYMYSKFHIICPNLANNPVTIKQPLVKENLYENIWIVDKKSFENCVVNSTIDKNTNFFNCDEPLKLKYHTMIFLPTTSSEKLPEFEFGEDHYFIATSNGSQDSLGSTAMGHCHTRNMRFIIHVCKDRNDPVCKEARGPDPQARLIPDNITATQHPPTDRKATENAVASKRKAECFISAHETIWLILVCVLGALVFLLLLSHVFLCCRSSWRKSRSPDSPTDQKLDNLLLKNTGTNHI